MDSEHHGRSLIVHVWVENDHPEGLRARITDVSEDGDSDAYASTIVATVESVSATVRAWVTDFVGR